jgi:Cys-tRNA(Pro) deacylase
VKAATPAIAVCERAGISIEVLRYEIDDHADNYGPAAADALGLAHHVVFKTLITVADQRPVVAVVPVDHQCSLKAVAAALAAKRAEMAKPVDAERLTGYVVGGISPLGQKKKLPTLIDASASPLERVYVSGGRRGLQIGLAPHDLASLTGGRFVPLVD